MNKDGFYPPSTGDADMFRVHPDNDTFRVHPDIFKPQPVFPYPTNEPRFGGPCRDPNHHPGVLMISLQPGQVYEHVCPSCGTITRITQYHPMLTEKDEHA